MREKKFFKNAEPIKKIGIYCWSIIGLLLLIAPFFYFIYLIRIAIIPVIIAAAIAYLLSPLVTVLERKIKRIYAIVISYIIFLGIIFVIFFFVIPIIVDQFNIFFDKLPTYLQNLNNMISKFLQTNIIVKNIEDLIGKDVIPQETAGIIQYLINQLQIGGADIFQGVTVVTRSVINIILNLIIGPLIGFYIIKDASKIRNVFEKTVPPKFKLQVSTIIDKISTVAGRYIRGQLLVSLIVGILCTIVLVILKIDFPILLGFIAGITNLIPMLGPYIGGALAALVALFISPLKALLVILLFIAIQQLDNYVISPNIMKYQVGVHPAIIIFSLIAGGVLFGVWGLFLAVPVVAIIQEILKYYLLERRKITS